MSKGNNEARAIVEYIFFLFEAFLSSVNITAKNFEVAANTNTKRSIGDLAVKKAEIKYPKNTANRTCNIDETQETSFLQALDERIIFTRIPLIVLH
jgi:hypothetical protein